MKSTSIDNSSYKHVPVVEQMEKEEEIAVPSRRSKPLGRALLLLGAFLLCVVVVAMVAYRPSMHSTPSPIIVEDVVPLGRPPSNSSVTTTPCTFDECTRSMCNAETAPYVCLFHNGGVHGGCSPVPWTPETCTTQCDVAGCDDLEIPDSVQDCNQDCPQEWCEVGPRLCGSEAPYQCTDGASAFGCSADAYQWTFRVTEAACSSCCKASSCE